MRMTDAGQMKHNTPKKHYSCAVMNAPAVISWQLAALCSITGHPHAEMIRQMSRSRTAAPKPEIFLENSF